MYNLISYERFAEQMWDKYSVDDRDDVWNKIAKQGIGRLIEDEEYVLTNRETIEIDGYVIDHLIPLDKWVKWSVEEGESVKIFEDWSLEYDEVMDVLLEYFDTDLNGDGITYADMIFNAENPREKVYDLLKDITKNIFVQKLEGLRCAMYDFIKKLDSGEFKWN